MGSESEIFPWLVTDPEFWVRPTESSEINTKTTKRLPTRRPVMSFINTPYLPADYPGIESKVGLAMMRDLRGFSINSLFYVKKGGHLGVTVPLPGSRTTFRASLSSLIPTNLACLKCRSGVHSVNSICAISSVRTTATQFVFDRWRSIQSGYRINARQLEHERNHQIPGSSQ
jgi:hypothetical protein